MLTVLSHSAYFCAKKEFPSYKFRKITIGIDAIGMAGVGLVLAIIFSAGVIGPTVAYTLVSLCTANTVVAITIMAIALCITNRASRRKIAASEQQQTKIEARPNATKVQNH